MADKKTEKYIRLLKQKYYLGELVKWSAAPNTTFTEVVTLTLGKEIPKKPNMDYVEDEREAAERAVKKMMNSPEYTALFGEVIRADLTKMFAKAIHKLGDQIDNPNPWVANKAANDVATRYDKATAKDDGNTITVKVEGMPEIGVPDADEQ